MQKKKGDIVVFKCIVYMLDIVSCLWWTKLR